jgi:predicted metal-dependent hydrolase
VFKETSHVWGHVKYTVCRSARRRRTLALQIQQEGGIRVLAPERLSLKTIESFLRKRAGWIHRKLETRRQQRPRTQEDNIRDGGFATYRGAACLLRVTQSQNGRSGCAYTNGVIEIAVFGQGLSPAELGEEARLELRLWYKKQARREFQERVDHWAAKLGARPNRLIVTSPERRWGSCNARNVIRLNWRLILMPPPLLDYVVAHELCHVAHKNHARAYWRMLESVMPDCKQRRKQLREWERAAR